MDLKIAWIKPCYMIFDTDFISIKIFDYIIHIKPNNLGINNDISGMYIIITSEISKAK